ncbi:hypothetical protein [Curtobacterium ammoniigenes]|uniref:hypothetical protein n=1 Tax=Curtobacterium ammoniigenes TaxID=395387 RepID=UPI00082DC57F|nr:hypothetical protein [Curtobacterium ammoniigenes]
MSTHRIAVEYRAWSRWYPQAWRAANGAAMLGTFLDLADAEGRDRLTGVDKRSLVRGGLVARLDAVIPAAVRDGASTALVALLAAFSLFTGVVDEWAPWARASRQVWLTTAFPDPSRSEHLTFGPFLSPFVVAAAMVLAAFVAALVSAEQLYRLALAAAVVVGLITAAMGHFGLGHWIWLRGEPSLFVAVLSAIGLVGRRPAPNRLFITTAAWFVAFLVAAFVSGTGASSFASGRTGAGDFFFVVVGDGASTVGVLLAMIVALGCFLAHRRALGAVIIMATLPFTAVLMVHFRAYGGSPLAIGWIAAGYMVTVALSAFRAPGARDNASAA